MAIDSFALSLSRFSQLNREKVSWWLGIDKHESLSKNEKQHLDKLVKKHHIDVEYLETKSNTKSYLYTIEKARGTNDYDTLLFVEDDYLWLPEAVTEMVTAIETIREADYITPYDHPVRYDDNYIYGLDIPHWNNKIYLAGNRHYRSQESTCMTFMVKGKTMKEDLKIHQRYSSTNNKCPNDREMFRHLQQLKGNSTKKKRLLVGPMPSLATHAHLPYLAPIINWESIIKK